MLETKTQAHQQFATPCEAVHTLSNVELLEQSVNDAYQDLITMFLFNLLLISIFIPCFTVSLITVEYVAILPILLFAFSLIIGLLFLLYTKRVRERSNARFLVLTAGIGVLFYTITILLLCLGNLSLRVGYRSYDANLACTRAGYVFMVLYVVYEAIVTVNVWGKYTVYTKELCKLRSKIDVVVVA